MVTRLHTCIYVSPCRYACARQRNSYSYRVNVTDDDDDDDDDDDRHVTIGLCLYARMYARMRIRVCKCST